MFVRTIFRRKVGYISVVSRRKWIFHLVFLWERCKISPATAEGASASVRSEKELILARKGLFYLNEANKIVFPKNRAALGAWWTPNLKCHHPLHGSERRKPERGASLQMSREVMVKRNVIVPVGGGMFLIYSLIFFPVFACSLPCDVLRFQSRKIRWTWFSMISQREHQTNRIISLIWLINICAIWIWISFVTEKLLYSKFWNGVNWTRNCNWTRTNETCRLASHKRAKMREEPRLYMPFSKFRLRSIIK